VGEILSHLRPLRQMFTITVRRKRSIGKPFQEELLPLGGEKLTGCPNTFLMSSNKRHHELADESKEKMNRILPFIMRAPQDIMWVPWYGGRRVLVVMQSRSTLTRVGFGAIPATAGLDIGGI